MLFLVRAAPLLVLVLLAGCVERRLHVRTDPPGADVTVNGERIGRSPTTWRFTQYGDALVEVEKPGFEPAQRVVALKAPWYQKPGVDFFSDVLVPARIRDEHDVEIRLEPTRPLTQAERERGVAEMTRAADKWRRQLEASR
jgi:hypothetical protein